ncbi:hypothetical protein P9E34_04065 [Schinkia azotoformans]|uniref:hypothetical protein n=1 Tax=Schinkia azotoformans TaxID=1454 RepID=UPI002DB63B76|nr:hypothetical protein [Schinkia azotoformans]MEC1723921.1 hypothetical protein [Schinkia azotoformans]
MQGQGWIKLHREILDSELWHDVTTFRLFIYLIGKASHQDGIKINGIEIKRGQWLRSYRKLAQDLAYKEGRGLKEYSLKTISKCINKLISAERVTIQETEQGTLFTIVNYAKYQDKQEFEEETVNGTIPEQETNGKRTVNKNKNAKNAKNKEYINTSSRKSKTYEEESLYFQLAIFFFERIKENNPDHKEPNLQRWSDDIRKIIEIDKRTEEQVRYLMKWVQQDDFWKSNILSPSKLREKFDQLVIKVKSDKAKQPKDQKKKLISTERPVHLPEPEISDEMNKQIEEALKELPY